jgi:wyosine [tRNA(Phe)-imidazoG37] synthetase (radical SAM superfamily)
MKYLFGPVNSRRLGLSQGVDIIPAGICNFNCIYCEVNRPKQLSSERLEYTPVKEIIREIDSIFTNRELADAIDVFTITASGEPTLHASIGTIIKAIKERTKKPVTVLTNGGLLHLPEVRDDLALADIVVPSLDAALNKSFRKINRPAPDTDLETIISGIATFKQEFKGQLWLEVLLVKEINDRPEDIAALKEAISAIKPHKVQLNSVIRPPFESFCKPVLPEELETIAQKLGNTVEIIANFSKKDKIINKDIQQCDIIELLKRRPGTTDDICEALRATPDQIDQITGQLAQKGTINYTEHSSKKYWIINSKQEI